MICGCFEPDERVRTPIGPGVVIKDMRHEVGLQVDRSTVWVLLAAGDNPQPFVPGELEAG